MVSRCSAIVSACDMAWLVPWSGSERQVQAAVKRQVQATGWGGERAKLGERDEIEREKEEGAKGERARGRGRAKGSKSSKGKREQS